jgi:hypothetical protein
MPAIAWHFLFFCRHGVSIPPQHSETVCNPDSYRDALRWANGADPLVNLAAQQTFKLI